MRNVGHSRAAAGNNEGGAAGTPEGPRSPEAGHTPVGTNKVGDSPRAAPTAPPMTKPAEVPRALRGVEARALPGEWRVVAPRHQCESPERSYPPTLR